MRLTARGRRFLLGLILTIGLLIMVTGAMQVFVDRAVTARCGDLVPTRTVGSPGSGTTR
jgi:hypothetical protein